MKPVLRWVGGKASVMKHITPLIPDLNGVTYFEPFIGAGSVFLSLRETSNANSFTICDTNKHLINFYKRVRDDLHYMKEIADANRESLLDTNEMYIANRNALNNDIACATFTIDSAVKFLYLNKCGFNGLYRENNSGFINTPYGHNTRHKKKPVVIFDWKKLEKLSSVLQNVTIQCGTYQHILNLVSSNTFVYLDPPYAPIKTDSFTSFSKDEFDQVQFADDVDKLNASGCKFLLSQSDTELTRRLFSKYDIIEINVKRSVAGDKDKRSKISELLIKNY